MNTFPEDVLSKYIYKDDSFIIVEDPKSSKEYFHYTIWSIENIETIFNISKKCIIDLNSFLKDIKKLDYFKNILNNALIYFTYIPTYYRLHLHIVPNNYISHRDLNELYYFSDIENIYNNINLVKKINTEKQNSIHLNLKFKIGIIILKNHTNIYKLNDIKYINDIDYIIVIRRKNDDCMIEYLLNNNKLINHNLISENLNNYNEMLKYDYLICV